MIAIGRIRWFKSQTRAEEVKSCPGHLTSCHDLQTRSDLSVQLARLISAHTADTERDHRWLNAIPPETKPLAKWLRAGYHLGVLERVSRSSILSVLGEQIASPISTRWLVEAGRFDCLLTDETSATRLIDLLLSRPCRPNMERAGSPPLYLLPMLLGIGASDRRRYLAYRLVEQSRFKSEVDGLGVPGLSFGTALERQAFDISASFRETIQTSGLPLTSETFEDTLGKCLSNWGERPAIISMGTMICNMPSRKGRKRLKAVGLFEHDKPLYDRLRTAKLRSKTIGWWHEQLELAATPMEKFSFNLFCGLGHPRVRFLRLG